MFDVSLVPVFVATIAAMAIGMVWYSPQVFGVAWEKEAKIPSDAKDDSLDTLWKMILVALLQNFIIIYILSHFLLIADAYPGVNVLVAGVWMAILVAATQLGSVIWEKKSLVYLGINAGYLVTVLLIATVIISKWPWA